MMYAQDLRESEITMREHWDGAGNKKWGGQSHREVLDRINRINKMFEFCCYGTVIPVILYILSNPVFGVPRGILSASLES
jgi:hypothetical protein